MTLRYMNVVGGEHEADDSFRAGAQSQDKDPLYSFWCH